MDDNQLALLIAVLKPISDAAKMWMEQQHKVDMPNLFRPIEEFDGFDFEAQIPGCRVIARDKFGPTEIEYNGRVCRRYRSSEDDSKGIDIRYRCVISGTVADKNMVWGSLIKFGEPRKVKPLNTAVREKIEERKASAPDPVVKAAAALGGTVRQAQPDPQRVAALNALNLLINEATIEGVDLTSATKPQDGDDVATLNMRASTLRNLIDAKKRSGAPPATAAPATPEPAPAGDALRGEGVAMKLQGMSKQLGTRSSTPAQDEQTIAALEALCGGEAGRQQFTDAVFRKAAYKQLLPSQRLAIFQWLRPTGHGAEARALNEHAAGSVRDVLAYAKTLQAVTA